MLLKLYIYKAVYIYTNKFNLLNQHCLGICLRHIRRYMLCMYVLQKLLLPALSHAHMKHNGSQIT